MGNALKAKRETLETLEIPETVEIPATQEILETQVIQETQATQEIAAIRGILEILGTQATRQPILVTRTPALEFHLAMKYVLWKVKIIPAAVLKVISGMKVYVMMLMNAVSICLTTAASLLIAQI